MSDKPGSNFNTKREKQGFIELKQGHGVKKPPRRHSRLKQ